MPKRNWKETKKMRYWLDTEFNGYEGALISLALVREDNEYLYVILPRPANITDWVKENVMPILEAVPQRVKPKKLMHSQLGQAIETFMKGDEDPVIITDWPDDITYFCENILTGPGTMINIPRLSFRMHRVDAYPNTIFDRESGMAAVQHNAYWDALSLMVKCIDENLEQGPEVCPICGLNGKHPHKRLKEAFLGDSKKSK
jgi:hypothetical protein